MLYVDTGATYRSVALAAQQKNTSLTDEPAVVALIQELHIQLRQPTETEKDGRLTTVLLDGKDVSWAIRSEEVSANASKVAAFAAVRRELVKLQQEIARQQDVVMEGRDITYRVLPTAQLKIFLTASVAARAQRRLQDLQTHGHDTTYKEVYKDLEERDERDSRRQADPLQVVPDAWVLDTTDLTIEEAIEQIVERATKIRAQK